MMSKRIKRYYFKSLFSRITLLSDFSALTACVLALATLPQMLCRAVAPNVRQCSKRAVLSLAAAGSISVPHCSCVLLLRR